jgi:prepilin-type N-terminal cleavage/methylation domain-containing protein
MASVVAHAGRHGRQAGFTLVELLLSVSILGIMVALTLPVYTSFAQRNDLDLAGQQLAGALRRAQTYARGVKDDSAWSVEVSASTVTLFKGTSFGTRDTADDETFSIPGTVTVTGLSEVQFSKFASTPNTTGTITLTSSANDVRTITVNAKGRIEY